MYPSIAKDPTALLGELDDRALGLQEEKVFGIGDGEGGIGLLGAVGNFAANSTDEDLGKSMLVKRDSRTI